MVETFLGNLFVALASFMSNTAGLPLFGNWLSQCNNEQRISLFVAMLAIFYFSVRAFFERSKFIARKAADSRIRKIKSMPVAFSEYDVEGSFFGIEVVGRIDEIRRFGSKVLMVGDIKTRPVWQVKPEDVEALSLYRYLLAKEKGGVLVASTGYIRFIDPDTGAESFKEVSLHGDAWCIALIRRYAEVALGNRPATQKANVASCGKCEFVSACYRLKDDSDEDEDDDDPLLCHDGYTNSAPGWSIGGLGGGL